jgi:hypothetical protein
LAPSCCPILQTFDPKNHIGSHQFGLVVFAVAVAEAAVAALAVVTAALAVVAAVAAVQDYHPFAFYPKFLKHIYNHVGVCVILF